MRGSACSLDLAFNGAACVRGARGAGARARTTSRSTEALACAAAASIVARAAKRVVLLDAMAAFVIAPIDSRLLATCLLVLTACSGSGSGGGDADLGVDAAPADLGADFALPEVQEAAPPQEPVFACPPGWLRDRESDTGTACGLAAFIGGSRCEDHATLFEDDAERCGSVGSTCDAPFPTAASAVYVREGSSGDGTEASPFGSLDDALASGAATVRVEPGAYAPPTAPLSNVAIVGRCASDVRIRADSDVAFDVVGAVRLSNVLVEGGERGVVVRDDAVLEADRFAILDAQGVAIEVEAGGRLIAERIFLRRSAEVVAIEGMPSAGLRLRGDATIRGSVIRGFTNEQIDAEGSDASLRIEDTLLGGTLDLSSVGRGLEVERGARAVLRRTEIVGTSELCAFVSDRGSYLDCEECTFAFCGDDEFSTGVVVSDGASADVRVSSLFASGGHVFVQDEGSTVRVEDSYLSSASTAFGGRGIGVAIAEGARAELRRVQVAASSRNEVRLEGGELVAA
ncbi:MAG: hypothetical protein AAF645_03765, partial [Myxococcota bacterium]